MRKQKGFTLVEIMLSLAIIGSLAAVMLSNMNAAKDDADGLRAANEIAFLVNTVKKNETMIASLPPATTNFTPVIAKYGGLPTSMASGNNIVNIFGQNVLIVKHNPGTTPTNQSVYMDYYTKSQGVCRGIVAHIGVFKNLSSLIYIRSNAWRLVYHVGRATPYSVSLAAAACNAVVGTYTIRVYMPYINR